MRRVVLADDHPLFRAALTQAVRRAAPSADIVEAGSLQDARAALQAGQTDLLCLDLHMSDSDGFAGLTELRADHPAVPVAVISASQTSGVAARALEFGAAGFIPKTSSLDELCEALSAVLEGEIWAPEDEGGEDEALENAARLATLTPAQMRVLRGLTAGRLNKQIAYDMSISEATVKAHVTAVFRKLGVINRTQAVLVAQALQVEPPAQT
ncbi:MAG: response regulator transcription factor [Pseudomonadota bacterium]